MSQPLTDSAPSLLKRQLFAEFAGTAALLCAVIGSGIMAERLSAGNNGVALLANTLATVFALYVLIEIMGPVSGAHFNPLVTLVVWLKSTSTQQASALSAIYFITTVRLKVEQNQLVGDGWGHGLRAIGLQGA